MLRGRDPYVITYDEMCGRRHVQLGAAGWAPRPPASRNRRGKGNGRSGAQHDHTSCHPVVADAASSCMYYYTWKSMRGLHARVARPLAYCRRGRHQVWLYGHCCKTSVSRTMGNHPWMHGCGQCDLRLLCVLCCKEHHITFHVTSRHITLGRPTAPLPWGRPVPRRSPRGYQLALALHAFT